MICQVKIIILAWPSVPTYSGTVLVLLINDQGEKEKGRDEPHAKPEKRGFGEVALLALRNETIYAVTDYRLDVNRLDSWRQLSLWRQRRIDGLGRQPQVAIFIATRLAQKGASSPTTENTIWRTLESL